MIKTHINGSMNRSVQNEMGGLREQIKENMLENMKNKINLLEKEKLELLESNKKHGEAAEKFFENESNSKHQITELKAQIYDSQNLIQLLNETLAKFQSDNKKLKIEIDSIKKDKNENLKSIKKPVKSAQNESLLTYQTEPVKHSKPNDLKIDDKDEKDKNGQNLNETHQTDLIKQAKQNNLKQEETEPYKYKTRSKIISTSSRLKRHIRTQIGKSTYKCKTCGKVFATIQNLNQHTRVHADEKPFKCKTCGHRFTIISNLKRHMLSHSGERPHECEICGRAFNRKDCLNNHKMTHTANESSMKPIENIDSRNQSSRKSKRKPIIKRQIVTSDKLKTHTIANTAQKPFKCLTCGDRFNNRTILKRHKRTHTGERPYTCETCGKGFTTSSNLNVHTRIHTGAKPFECEICGKKFGHKHVLNNHKLTHY